MQAVAAAAIKEAGLIRALEELVAVAMVPLEARQVLLVQQIQAVEVVVELQLHQVMQEAQVVLESLSSRLTNKDIHAKQSLSILWN
jgi:hypothetical protein